MVSPEICPRFLKLAATLSLSPLIHRKGLTFYLFPEVKVTIGPAIENGFYYDFDREQPFTPEDLKKIEKKMKELIKKNQPFSRREVSREKALKQFADLGENYKLELINELPEGETKLELINELPEGETISLYQVGNFIDLCRGPHIPKTGLLKGGAKLLSVAGAYWRGDGTAFASKVKLQEHLNMLEEAKRRDHRKLGKELELFSISDEAGAGFIIWHPKGALLRTILEDFEKREHLRRGYQIVIGPQLLKQELWQKSGHYDHYRENITATKNPEFYMACCGSGDLPRMMLTSSAPLNNSRMKSPESLLLSPIS